MSKEKILIVDDVASNIHMLNSMLKENYSIIAAKDGMKAIELACKVPKPDVILLDIVMPNMDGYEVCAKLKSLEYTKDIPIIFVSSLNDIEEQEKAIKYGGSDYLLKPVTKAVLLNKIKTQIQLTKCQTNTINIYEGNVNMRNNPPKILIVDDAPQNIQVAVEILKDKYTVSVATNGEKALSMLEQGLNPDLVLLDIIMPDMDGFEVCRRLKANEKYEHIPVIYLTVLENDNDMVKGLELGAVDYVTKPFEAKVLKARVDTHIRLKAYQDELVENIKEKDKILIEQSKLATLGEMFENITHQWKQPLSVISMVSSTIKLENELGTLDDKSLMKLLGNVDKSIDYLSDTVEDFRDFLIRDTPKEYFNVRQVVENSLKVLDSKIQCNEIELKINLDDYELQNYKNDLMQVLMNIFSNSIHALKNNTSSKYINVSYKIDDKMYVLKIEDNGGGISAEIIDKIFDKYFSTKEHDSKAGLGLYMCKRIIEDQMNGKLEVRSEKKETVLEIKLPL